MRAMPVEPNGRSVPAISRKPAPRRLRDRPTRVIEEWGDEGMKLLLILVALQLAGCAAVPELVGAKHHCDPSNDEQFKQNASWDARTQDEYLVERVQSG
jgi:hypothetical protein